MNHFKNDPEIIRIFEQLDKYNTCNVTADCVKITGECPFECMPYVHKDNADVAQSMMNKYMKNPKCMYDCLETPNPVCIKNKCVPPLNGGYKSDLIKYLRYTFSLIIYIYICIEIFVTMPMNGVWRLPGNWNKDLTILYGISASLFISSFAVYNYQLPFEVSIIGLVIMYVHMLSHPKFDTP